LQGLEKLSGIDFTANESGSSSSREIYQAGGFLDPSTYYQPDGTLPSHEAGPADRLNHLATPYTSFHSSSSSWELSGCLMNATAGDKWS